MDLITRLPDRVFAGRVIEFPLVIVFRVARGQRVERSGLWATVSLLVEYAGRYWTVSDSNLLQGQTVDSIHPIPHEEIHFQDCVGFASFRNLVVSRPGRYRLRVDLIDMNQEHGVVMPAIASHAFDVIGEETIGVSGRWKRKARSGGRMHC